jgi:hypothetical protein
LSDLYTFTMVRTLSLEAFAGLWVGVDANGSVLASADTLANLLESIDQSNLTGLEILRAPHPEDGLVYGLG